jgi:hypothetical protein
VKTIRPKFPWGHPFTRQLPVKDGSEESNREFYSELAKLFHLLVERYRLKMFAGSDNFWRRFAMSLLLDCVGDFPESKARIGAPKRTERSGTWETLSRIHECWHSVIRAHPDWPKSQVKREVLRRMKRDMKDRFAGSSPRTYRRWLDEAINASSAIQGAKLVDRGEKPAPGTLGSMLLEAYNAFPKRR